MNKRKQKYKRKKGLKYEQECAKILRSRGFYDVIVTKGSGDQGADIIARKWLSKYAIQCKYYSKPVGNKAVQEAYAAMKFYGCNKAAVMTNSSFTASAKELAKKTGVELWSDVWLKGGISAIPFMAIISGMLAIEYMSKISFLSINENYGYWWIGYNILWYFFLKQYVYSFIHFSLKKISDFVLYIISDIVKIIVCYIKKISNTFLGLFKKLINKILKRGGLSEKVTGNSEDVKLNEDEDLFNNNIYYDSVLLGGINNEWEIRYIQQNKLDDLYVEAAKFVIKKKTCIL